MERRLRWTAAFLIAAVHDIVDIIGPGSIPIGGDVVDAATTLVLFPLVGGPEPFITAAELVPAADILPIFTLVTAATFYRRAASGSEEENDALIDGAGT
ncbi:MAG: hypothetical protein SVW02_02440 [Candidatus Nanohaloarchaea archaeon]|nr:hypothetical protein [Candidatus Nanohaloarchaea archaeon]